MNKIIVIGVTHHNTLGVIRSIGISGCSADLILIANNRSFVARSRYIRRVFLVSSEHHILDVLLKEYSNEIIKPIIISCSDMVESVLDRNYSLLHDRFFFFHSNEEGKVTLLMDKQRQGELAESVGLSVPTTSIFKDDFTGIQFPCILRPRQSINGGKQLSICYNPTELASSLDAFTKSEEILVQQYIKKDFEIVVLGISNGKDVFIPGYIKKIREYRGGTLYSSVAPAEALDSSLFEKCKRLVSLLEYDGLFGIEFIHSNGIDYFVEVNLRNDATSYSMTVAGCNLPLLYVKTIIGEVPFPEKSETINNIYSIVEFNDIRNRKLNGISLSKWIIQFFTSKCKYYFSAKDIKPFLYAPFK